MGWDADEYLPILLGLCFLSCGMSKSLSIWANCLNLKSPVWNTRIAVSKLVGWVLQALSRGNSNSKTRSLGTSSELQIKFEYHYSLVAVDSLIWKTVNVGILQCLYLVAVMQCCKTSCWHLVFPTTLLATILVGVQKFHPFCNDSIPQKSYIILKKGAAFCWDLKAYQWESLWRLAKRYFENSKLARHPRWSASDIWAKALFVNSLLTSWHRYWWCCHAFGPRCVVHQSCLWDQQSAKANQIQCLGRFSVQS